MIPWLKIGFIAAAALALILAVHLWDAREKALGAAKIEAADARALAASAVQRAAQALVDIQTNKDAVDGLQKERDRLAALLALPQPRLVCHADRSGQTPSTTVVAGGAIQTAASAGASDSLRAGDPGVDISPDVLTLAGVAEALASQNRALLAREHGLETRGPEVAQGGGPR